MLGPMRPKSLSVWLKWLKPAARFATKSSLGLGLALAQVLCQKAAAQENVYLTDVPDYDWYAGCFGTATGNLMGFWDRHGMSDFYTGPTAGGVAPLNSYETANRGIYSLWVSKAGRDGRPYDKLGHEDDYYVAYESVAPDPYVTAGRAEHPADCIGDFIGLNQNKWTGLGGECDGNIDGFSYNFFDATGNRRVNYTPPMSGGKVVTDIQSGIRAWSKYRGYDADVYSQLSELNPETPAGKGFTWDDLRREIKAGYPVLVFLQSPYEKSRYIGSMKKANPEIHGMLIFGYYDDGAGNRSARIRNSWGSSTWDAFRPWRFETWTPSIGNVFLPTRGFITFHPRPKLKTFTRAAGAFNLTWEGPSSEVMDESLGTTTLPHKYVVERATTLNPPNFEIVAGPTTTKQASIPMAAVPGAYFRLRIVDPQ